MFVVDASVWVARYKPLDVYHDMSADWLKRVFGGGIQVVCPTLLLPETTGAIGRRGGELAARRTLSELTRLLTLRIVPLGHDLATLAARFAARFRMRGADSVYVALAYDLDMTLVTWDEEQRERGAKVITVSTPEELLAAP